MTSARDTDRMTIILPAYVPAGERAAEAISYLETALDSVLGQRDPRWLCLVYDNSPDPAVVAGLVDRLDDLRFEHRPNPQDVGLLGSMNRGLSEARTPLVGFLHGDDELTPDYVASVMDLSLRHPEVAAMLGGVEVIDGAGQPIRPIADRIKSAISPARRREAVISGDAAIARLMFGMWAYSPALVVRTAALEGLRFDESNLYSGDTEFITDLLARGGSIVASPLALYRYRRHGVSGTVLMTQDGTRARLEREFFSRKARELDGLGFRRGAMAARIRPFARAASLGRIGRAAAARSYR